MAKVELISSSHITDINQELIGNKAFYLSKLIDFGFNIPVFVVITVTAFEQIRKEYKLDTIDGIFDIKNIQKEIKQEISTYVDKEILMRLGGCKLAVRSSTTVEDGFNNSWAGQFQSFLNIEADMVAEKITECWLSIYSPSAIEYGKLLGQTVKNCKIAVILQKMVTSEFSGVLFTQNSSNGSTDEIVIECTNGLGDKLVQGETIPNLYVYNKKDKLILKQIINNDYEAISTQRLHKLLDTCIEIESKMGFPCDIEWSFEKNDLYILQVRPLTSVAKEQLMVSHQSDLLTQDLVLTGVFKYCKFKKYGFTFDFPFIKYSHLTGDIFYPSNQVKEFEKNKSINFEILKSIISDIRQELFDFKNYLTVFKKEINNSITPNITNVIKEFFDKSYRVVGYIPYFICFEIILSNRLNENGISLNNIPTRKTKTVEAYETLLEIKNKYPNVIKNIKYGLHLPKEFLSEIDSFCENYGYLGMLYFKGHKWSVIDVLQMITHDDILFKDNSNQESINLNQCEYIEVTEEFLELRTVKWEIMCYACSLFKEFFINHFSRIIHYEYILSMRISQIIDITSSFYTSSNINEKASKDFELLITEHGVILNNNAVSNNDKTITDTNNNELLHGISANQGYVNGIAKVILDASDFRNFDIGDILITKMSTPNFLPIMKKASAFLTEIGGVTSHASIIARELNKPCIIGVKNITTIIKNGDYLEIDAHKGIIKIIKS